MGEMRLLIRRIGWFVDRLPLGYDARSPDGDFRATVYDRMLVYRPLLMSSLRIPLASTDRIYKL